MLYGLFLFVPVVCCVCACGAECVNGLFLVPSVKLAVFCASVCWCVCAWFVYDVPCGVVWFVCCCLSLCVWMFVWGMKCLAAVFVCSCVMMCGVVWPA